MLFVERYIFFFLWFVTVKCADITSIINEVNINLKDKEIQIYNFKYNINILFDPERLTRKDEITMDKVNAFYLILSCSVAEQTLFDLGEYILDFPLFYSLKFLNTDNKNKFMKYKNNNNNKFVIMLEKIVKNITDFLQIFNYFINSNSDFLYYKDNAILRIFVLLKIKIEILLSENNVIKQKLNDSDMLLIREILEEISAIKVFLSLNCDNSTSYTEELTSKWFGYTIIKPLYYDFSWIEIFESNVEPDRCPIEHILLQNFVGTQSSDLAFSYDIGNTNSNITNKDGYIKIKDVFEQIQSSYDINIIYWYMKSILAAIIKLLYSRIIEGMQKMYITTNIITMIKYIDTKISQKKYDYSMDIVKAFDLLKHAKNRDHFDDDEKYLEVISMLFKGYSDITPDIILEKYKIDFDGIHDMNKRDDYNTKTFNTEASDFEKYMIIFLREITTKGNLSEFQCFSKYLGYFENLFNKQYLPINNYKITTLESIDNVKYSEECYFIIDMYFISYKSVIDVNKIINQNNFSEKKKYFMKTKKAMDDIKNNFINYNNTLKRQLELFEVGKDIISVLENMPKQFLDFFFLKRIINFINAKLQNWALKYCTQPTFNFLLFNNIQLIKFGDNDDEIIAEKNKFQIMVDSKFKSLYDKQCFDYAFLYREYIENDLKLYSENIFIQSQDQKRTIKNVYDDLNNLFFNSHYLYIFYDISFKLFIAAYYYELRTAYKYYQNNTQKKKFNKYKIIPDLTDTSVIYCPEYLDILFKRIVNLENQMYNNNMELNDEEFSKEYEAIEKEITNFNISFNYEINIKNYDDSKRRIDKLINNILKLYTQCYLKTLQVDVTVIFKHAINTISQVNNTRTYEIQNETSGSRKYEEKETETNALLKK